MTQKVGHPEVKTWNSSSQFHLAPSGGRWFRKEETRGEVGTGCYIIGEASTKLT